MQILGYCKFCVDIIRAAPTSTGQTMGLFTAVLRIFAIFIIFIIGNVWVWFIRIHLTVKYNSRHILILFYIYVTFSWALGWGSAGSLRWRVWGIWKNLYVFTWRLNIRLIITPVLIHITGLTSSFWGRTGGHLCDSNRWWTEWIGLVRSNSGMICMVLICWHGMPKHKTWCWVVFWVTGPLMDGCWLFMPPAVCTKTGYKDDWQEESPAHHRQQCSGVHNSISSSNQVNQDTTRSAQQKPAIKLPTSSHTHTAVCINHT